MRLNPNTTSDLINLIDISKREEESALRQLSSGRRVSLPSEDPSAIATTMLDAARYARDDQFIESGATVRDAMSVADSSLNSVVVALQRAIALGIEGGTGTQSSANRMALAQEVDGITEQVLGVANLSYRNSYLFAGTANVKPFVSDATAEYGIRYDGNEQTIEVRITESMSVTANHPGSTIFRSPQGDVFRALGRLRASLAANDQDGIQEASTEVRNALDQVVATRAQFGNAINQLDASRQFLTSEQLSLKERENTQIGADPEKAASDLNQAQLAHQAVLQAIGRQSRLSLLDVLS